MSSENAKSETSADAVDRFRKLVAQATDTAVTEEEARTNAVLALRLMKEQNLVCVPQSELERATKAVEGANARLARSEQAAKQDKVKNMFIGAALGAVLAPKLGIKIG